MINIIIKENQADFFKTLLPGGVSMQAGDPGTLSFCLPRLQFQSFYQLVKSKGDPFALMTWQERARHCSKPPFVYTLSPGSLEAATATT